MGNEQGMRYTVRFFSKINHIGWSSFVLYPTKYKKNNTLPSWDRKTEILVYKIRHPPTHVTRHKWHSVWIGNQRLLCSSASDCRSRGPEFLTHWCCFFYHNRKQRNPYTTISKQYYWTIPKHRCMIQ